MTILSAGGLRNRTTYCPASGMESARAGCMGANSGDRLASAERKRIEQDAGRPGRAILGPETCHIRRPDAIGRAIARCSPAPPQREILLGPGHHLWATWQMGECSIPFLLGRASLSSNSRHQNGSGWVAPSNALEGDEKKLCTLGLWMH